MLNEKGTAALSFVVLPWAEAVAMPITIAVAAIIVR